MEWNETKGYRVWILILSTTTVGLLMLLVLMGFWVLDARLQIDQQRQEIELYRR